MPMTTSTTVLRGRALDPQLLAPVAEWLAVGVAVSLPWSTSATSILIALWLVAVLPTLNMTAVRRELETAPGGLPVALWLLAALGMLWADVSWSERLGGLGGFHRLLFIPLLLAQFRRSAHGMRVLHGFFISVVVLLVISWALVLFPGLPWPANGAIAKYGIPVKDYILQSGEFLIAAFALFGFAFDYGAARQWRRAAGLAALAVLFLANIFFVITGRSTLLVGAALLLLLGWRQVRWQGLAVALAVGVAGGALVWWQSPYLHARLDRSMTELQSYEASDAFNSTGLHLEFIKKSVSFVETAPLFGHGTGSIAEQFRNAAAGGNGSSSVASVNPHNQVLGVAIQLGLVGAVVLLAMWLAHLLLFRGGGMTAWLGAIIVVQNIVFSLFNSHLFDFSQGWLYVFGVGVAGGMTLRERDIAGGATKASS
jgi:O-antigen ligase